MCTVSNMTPQIFPGGPYDPWAVPKYPQYPSPGSPPNNPWAIPPFDPFRPFEVEFETDEQRKAREIEEQKKLEDFYKKMHPNMIPWGTVTPDLATQLLEIISKLEALDKRMGNIECKLQEDEKKAIIDKLEGIANGDSQPQT